MSNVYNCHTHIFNIKNAPKRFLEGFIPKYAAKIAWPIMNTRIGSRATVFIINKFISNPVAKKLASFLKVGTMKSQNHIFNDLKSYYSDGDKFVIHTINMDYMGAGRAKYSFKEQIHEIKRIKAQNIESCLPFYSIDPRANSEIMLQKNAQVHIEKKGFVGIKIYPANGFYPFDPHLATTYEWASEKKIPIMTHCTRVGSFYLGAITQNMINPDSLYSGPLANWPENFSELQFPISGKIPENKDFCDNFSEIHNYAKILQVYNNLKICFAHAGGVDEIISNKKPVEHLWFHQIKHLMKTYDHVYTDISYTLYKKEVFPQLLELIKDKDIGHKVLFGTDFFMTLKEEAENKLIEKFKTYILKNYPEENLWKKISHDNPKAYLSSEYYVA